MGYCWRLSSSLPVGTKGQCHFHFFNNTLQCLLLFVGVRAKASIFQPIVCVLHDCQNARLYHVVQRTIPSKQTTRQDAESNRFIHSQQRRLVHGICEITTKFLKGPLQRVRNPLCDACDPCCRQRGYADRNPAAAVSPAAQRLCGPSHAAAAAVRCTGAQCQPVKPSLQLQACEPTRLQPTGARAIRWESATTAVRMK